MSLLYHIKAVNTIFCTKKRHIQCDVFYIDILVAHCGNNYNCSTLGICVFDGHTC